MTAPRGFSTTSGKSPQTQLNEETNLDISIKDALREWDSIQRAFTVLKNELERALKQLPAGYADRRESPFGTPLQYGSFAAAGIWMNYYMGMIQLHRCHPNMPPAAMPAAHQADAYTKDYAILIGRIAAGLSTQSTAWAGTRIDVNIGAAYVESAFCLFVAGVQVRHLIEPGMSSYKHTDEPLCSTRITNNVTGRSGGCTTLSNLSDGRVVFKSRMPWRADGPRWRKWDADRRTPGHRIWEASIHDRYRG